MDCVSLLHAVPPRVQLGARAEHFSRSQDMSFSILVAALMHRTCRQRLMEVLVMVSDQEPCDGLQCSSPFHM